MAGPDGDSAAAALQRYSAFVEDVLRPQLTQTLARRDALTREMNEYQELQELLRELLATRTSAAETASPPKPLEVLMDLGQQFRVRAKIPDTSLVTVDVGLNFHVEMTLDEAQAFVGGHLAHLAGKRDEWQQKARQVSDHVNVVIESIQKLAALPHA